MEVTQLSSCPQNKAQITQGIFYLNYLQDQNTAVNALDELNFWSEYPDGKLSTTNEVALENRNFVQLNSRYCAEYQTVIWL